MGRGSAWLVGVALLAACASADPTPAATVEPLSASPTAPEADAATTDVDVPGAAPTSPPAPVATTDEPPGSDPTPASTDPATPSVVELASGSGCTPGRTDGLPDGRWFGSLEEVDTETVVFDLACWFSGEAATRAAAEDGEESPPPNDYYVRNDNDLLRTIAVAPSAEVVWLPSPADPASAATTAYDDWLVAEVGRPFRPSVWLTVEGDRVVAIEEQYVP